ncbi:hypothetical protein AgCh_004859 [Apium graveolens]
MLSDDDDGSNGNAMSKNLGKDIKHRIGKNVPKKDRVSFLVNTLLDVQDSKEAVYGTLDSWAAWEREFPIGHLKQVLITLEKEQQWHRVVQVIKWMLSKGQGTTMNTYGQLIRALDMDHRVKEAHAIWVEKVGDDMHSVPWNLCKLMIGVYYRNNMLDNLVKLSKNMEAYDRKINEKSVLMKIADSYEMLGLVEEKDRILKKYSELIDDTSRKHTKKYRGTPSKKKYALNIIDAKDPVSEFTLHIIDTPGLVEAGAVNYHVLDIYKRSVAMWTAWINIDGLGHDDFYSIRSEASLQVVGAGVKIRRQEVQHEAGHFLIAYLMGVLPKGYTLSSLEAFQMEGSLNVQAGTAFVDVELIMEKFQQLFSCIVLAGVATEYVLCGYAEGGLADINQLDSLLNGLGFTQKKANSHVRWDAPSTPSWILRRCRGVAVVEFLQNNTGRGVEVPRCLRRENFLDGGVNLSMFVEHELLIVLLKELELFLPPSPEFVEFSESGLRESGLRWLSLAGVKLFLPPSPEFVEFSESGLRWLSLAGVEFFFAPSPECIEFSESGLSESGLRWLSLAGVELFLPPSPELVEFSELGLRWLSLAGVELFFPPSPEFVEFSESGLRWLSLAGVELFLPPSPEFVEFNESGLRWLSLAGVELFLLPSPEFVEFSESGLRWLSLAGVEFFLPPVRSALSEKESGLGS